MKIINREILEKYIKKKKSHELKKHIDIWLKKTKDADWKNCNDIRINFTRVSILPHNRIVFDIVGGSYRLSVIIVFVLQNVRIEWIGSHNEYDRLDLTKKIIKKK